METLLVSTGVVALTEIGDKTQLLALLLATRSISRKGSQKCPTPRADARSSSSLSNS